MHQMLTLAINDPERLSVCPSNGFTVQTQLNGLRSCLELKTLGDPRNTAFDRSPYFPPQI